MPSHHRNTLTAAHLEAPQRDFWRPHSAPVDTGRSAVSSGSRRLDSLNCRYLQQVTGTVNASRHHRVSYTALTVDNPIGTSLRS